MVQTSAMLQTSGHNIKYMRQDVKDQVLDRGQIFGNIKRGC